MTMACNGLAKLIEECGELVQAASKKLAYYRTEQHPDGGPPLSNRLENEIADVVAACHFCIEVMELDHEHIRNRTAEKVETFQKWHADPTNNDMSVDRSLLAELVELTAHGRSDTIKAAAVTLRAALSEAKR